MATIAYRKNSIASLLREDGSIAVDHEEKAGLLWHSYKQRLGVTVNIDNEFDFAKYITPHEHLESLSAPFSMREIDDIIKHLPNAKALGTDGFTCLFFKKCWHIIRWDVYDLCRDFWSGQETFRASMIPLSPSSPKRMLLRAKMTTDQYHF